MKKQTSTEEIGHSCQQPYHSCGTWHDLCSQL